MAGPHPGSRPHQGSLPMPKARPVGAWSQPGQPRTLPDRIVANNQGARPTHGADGRPLQRWGSDLELRKNEEEDLVDLLMSDGNNNVAV